jgi:hypothetical protein
MQEFEAMSVPLDPSELGEIRNLVATQVFATQTAQVPDLAQHTDQFTTRLQTSQGRSESCAAMWPGIVSLGLAE